MRDWPVSVKGVLGPPGSFVLLHNERDEWELPGGRLDNDDRSLRHALEREIVEELELEVTVAAQPLRTWIYEPIRDRRVVIVTYACRLEGAWPDELACSHEHDDVQIVPVADLAGLRLPDGYRRDIEAAGLRG